MVVPFERCHHEGTRIPYLEAHVSKSNKAKISNTGVGWGGVGRDRFPGLRKFRTLYQGICANIRVECRMVYRFR